MDKEFNRYYLFADDEYDRGVGMSSCELRTNDLYKAIELGKNIKDVSIPKTKTTQKKSSHKRFSSGSAITP